MVGHYRASRRAGEAAWVQSAPLNPGPPNLAGLEGDHGLERRKKTPVVGAMGGWACGLATHLCTCFEGPRAMPRVVSRTQLCLNVQ